MSESCVAFLSKVRNKDVVYYLRILVPQKPLLAATASVTSYCSTYIY